MRALFFIFGIALAYAPAFVIFYALWHQLTGVRWPQLVLSFPAALYALAALAVGTLTLFLLRALWQSLPARQQETVSLVFDIVALTGIFTWALYRLAVYLLSRPAFAAHPWINELERLARWIAF